MDQETPLLTDAQQFRLDVMMALAEMNVEIDALRVSLKEGKVLSVKRLAEIRSDSHHRLDRFLKNHAKHIGLL
jgi:hypothetical protein